MVPMPRMMLPVFTAAQFLLAGCAGPGFVSSETTLTQLVSQREIAFAKTMADRDRNAFASFIADDAIFFSGDKALRGKDAILTNWSAFFKEAGAPFSWQPDTVQVLDSGMLALTSGPVHSADGKLIGRFNSIWRRETDAEWRVVFDKGSPVCDCAHK